MPEKKQPRSPKKEKPHDAVFKAFFSDAKIARNYLLSYSPPGIYQQVDFSFFRKIDTAFVSGRFGISFSDVVYETRLANSGSARLLFLFEHKSYLPTYPVHLQLLDYFLQLWEDDLKNKRPLSGIIPIVIYHGEQGWEQKSLSDYLPGLPKGWEVFVPNFNYLLTDLSRIPRRVIEDKQEDEYLRNLFLALKFARDKTLAKEILEEILTFEEPFYRDDRQSILSQLLTVYIINTSGMASTEYKTLKKELPKPSQVVIDFIREIYGDEIPWFIREEMEEKAQQEGLQKGMERGLQQGLELKSHTFTLKTLQKFPDWSDAEVADFVGVTMEYVQQVRRELAGEK